MHATCFVCRVTAPDKLTSPKYVLWFLSTQTPQIVVWWMGATRRKIDAGSKKGLDSEERQHRGKLAPDATPRCHCSDSCQTNITNLLTADPTRVVGEGGWEESHEAEANFQMKKTKEA